MKRLFIIVLIVAIIPACKVSYSFTGASIDPESKTIAIKEFNNRASLVNPALSPATTEALKDRFLAQTSLDLVNGDADLVFEGTITSYAISTQAVQPNETAASNRFTVKVKVKFTNKQVPDYDYETTFSAFRDFPASEDFTGLEDGMVEEILKDITEDIFNKAVVNW